MNDSKELLDFVTAILKKSVVGMSEAQIPGHRFVPSTPPGTPAKSETVETKPPMLRTLKIQNRFDQEYNVKNSAGYRDVSIILEVRKFRFAARLVSNDENFRWACCRWDGRWKMG